MISTQYPRCLENLGIGCPSQEGFQVAQVRSIVHVMQAAQISGYLRYMSRMDKAKCRKEGSLAGEVDSLYADR